MRLVTWNLNGIRAAIRKGLDEFVERINPDILLLQEVRALPEQLPKDWSPSMEHTLMHPAERKGYSGVATWAKAEFDEMMTHAFDDAECDATCTDTSQHKVPEKYKHLDYSSLVPLLIASIQEQQRRIEELESKLAE